MKFVAFCVFLAFALVLSNQDVQKRGGLLSTCKGSGTGENNKALGNLLQPKGKPIFQKLTVSNKCRVDMAMKPSLQEFKDAGTGKKTEFIRYDFNSETTCLAVGEPNLIVSVKAREETGVPLGTGQCLQAVFLNQDLNTNTYMILNPDIAPWFFTSQLSGCDIFVATTAENRNKPIVIHSNLNNCGNKAQNLEAKGKDVNELLKSNPGYRLRARVYSAPSRIDSAADQYLKRYIAAHEGIQLVEYDIQNVPVAKVQPFQFIGHYNQYWTFIVKGEKDGTATAQITLM